MSEDLESISIFHDPSIKRGDRCPRSQSQEERQHLWTPTITRKPLDHESVYKELQCQQSSVLHSASKDLCSPPGVIRHMHAQLIHTSAVQFPLLVWSSSEGYCSAAENLPNSGLYHEHIYLLLHKQSEGGQLRGPLKCLRKPANTFRLHNPQPNTVIITFAAL